MLSPIEARERLYTEEEVMGLITSAIRRGIIPDGDYEFSDQQIGELERLVTVVQ